MNNLTHASSTNSAPAASFEARTAHPLPGGAMSHRLTIDSAMLERVNAALDHIRAGARPVDLVTPGHVFPLKARRGGVLVRTGQTEGSVDLARLAGLKPSGVICEIMNADGTMARMPDLETFAKQHDLIILTIAD